MTMRQPDKPERTMQVSFGNFGLNNLEFSQEALMKEISTQQVQEKHLKRDHFRT